MFLVKSHLSNLGLMYSSVVNLRVAEGGYQRAWGYEIYLGATGVLPRKIFEQIDMEL